MTPLLTRLVLCLSLLLWPGAGPGAAAEESYRLSFGDALAISADTQTAMFTEQAPLTKFGREYPLRPDGRVTLPLIGEVLVGGMTVKQVITLLEGRYKPYLGQTHFVVNVVAFRPTTVMIMGEVNRPGKVELKPGATLLAALAEAGGLTDWAAPQRVTILREGRLVATADLDQLLLGQTPDVPLADRDIVRVEPRWYKPVLQHLPMLSSFVVGLATLLVVVSRGN